MAQSYVTATGSTLTIPGAYPSIAVQTANSGLSANGVVMLVGEADAGPDYTLESDITLNGFGPDQSTDVIAKYKSGPLVDAFKAASRPANDPGITGNPSKIFLVKTNVPSRASAALLKVGGGAYATIADKSFGKLGNLIYLAVNPNVTEAVPTTGLFTWVPSAGLLYVYVVVNGGSPQVLGIAAGSLPFQVAGFFSGLTGITGAGGGDRGSIANLTGAPAVAVNAAVANATVFTLTGKAAWDTTPLVGDSLYTQIDFAVANRGGWIVTAATATTITATKISDYLGTPGTVTAPTTAVAFTLTLLTNFRTFQPMSLSLSAGAAVDGIGKSLELAELTSGTDLLSRNVFQLGTVTQATWVSKAAAPTSLGSFTEYQPTLTVTRQIDGISDIVTAGGDIALKIGYLGTTATLTINNIQLITTVTGGAGISLTLNLKDFATLNDLAAFINAQTGYSCSVGTVTLGQLPCVTLSTNTSTPQYSTLDTVTGVNIVTVFGAQNGRIKKDGYAFFTKLGAGSQTVQIGIGLPGTSTAPVPSAIGLPGLTATSVYLTGGLRGGTSNLNVTGAIDACEKIRGNFLVPLFSRDFGLDVSLGLTDPTSSYTVDSINAYARGHVLALSTLKRRKNRQAFLSKKDTFANAQLAAGNIASFRCSMVFQDVKNVDSFGNINQYAPWMGAVVAAGMQAAAFYKAIFNKGINIIGALQAAGDYSDQSDSNTETALNSGLMPIYKSESGPWKWQSDQTTYGKDNNFVFNSVQAIYVADVIALTTAKRMQDAFLGESIADVSATAAMSFLQGIMNDFLRLKLIAGSDDAPAGYKNIVVKIAGPALIVSLEVKLAGAIYFIPINFLVSQVSQTGIQAQ